jgi:hypothetical protein
VCEQNMRNEFQHGWLQREISKRPSKSLIVGRSAPSGPTAK